VDIIIIIIIIIIIKLHVARIQYETVRARMIKALRDLNLL